MARSWSLPSNGIGSGSFDLNVAVTDEGTGIAAWTAVAVSGSEVFVAEQVAGYKLRLLTSELDGGVDQLTLRAGADGQAIAAWHQKSETANGIYVSSRSAPDRWTVPRLETDRLSFGSFAFDPALALGRGGHVVAAWNQQKDNLLVAQVATRGPAEDRFHRPSGGDDFLSLPINFVNCPRPAVNSHGDAIVVWSQSDGGELRVWVSEREGGDGAFSKPVSGEHLSVDAPGAEGGQYFVDDAVVAIADSGSAVAVWEHPYSEDATALVAAYRDPAGFWQRPVDSQDSFTPQQGVSRRAKVHFAPGGELFVTWYHDADGGERSVRLAQRDASGTWIHSGQAPLVLSDAVFATEPQLAVGDDGGVVVAWLETEANVMSVKVRRNHVDALGAWIPTETLWTGEADSVVHSLSLAIGASFDRALVGFVESGKIYLASI